MSLSPLNIWQWGNWCRNSSWHRVQTGQLLCREDYTGLTKRRVYASQRRGVSAHCDHDRDPILDGPQTKAFDSSPLLQRIFVHLFTLGFIHFGVSFFSSTQSMRKPAQKERKTWATSRVDADAAARGRVFELYNNRRARARPSPPKIPQLDIPQASRLWAKFELQTPNQGRSPTYCDWGFSLYSIFSPALRCELIFQTFWRVNKHRWKTKYIHIFSLESMGGILSERVMCFWSNWSNWSKLVEFWGIAKRTVYLLFLFFLLLLEPFSSSSSSPSNHDENKSCWVINLAFMT